jgi:N-acetylglucosaminyldiphosphoundecaprenol N-acetyl-beta-D-mannosaminyltransferase
MRKSILGVNVATTNYETANHAIFKWAHAGGSRYVCASNVHMVMEAWDSLDFRDVVNSADLVTPDGVPLVWMLRLKGCHNQQRVYGPTLMLHILEKAACENIPVGFYGGEPATLELLIKRMEARYPGLNVVFAHSPPFRAPSPEEDVEIVSRFRNSGARILFVGLGCPKQERWMAAHRGQIPAVMVGVGAAFDIHAAVKGQAPGWMQTIGLEWLFRFIQEPRRLWRRYLIQNPRFVLLALADLLGILKVPIP